MDKNALGLDLKRSSLLGPIQVLITTVTYALLYPIILKKSGLEVLGLWSFIASISLYMGLSDVGFSITLIRKISHAVDKTAAAKFNGDYQASVLFYKWFTVAALLAWGGIACCYYNKLPSVYSSSLLVGSISILIVGAGVQLVSQLDMAILVGVHETYYTKFICCILPAIRAVVGITGAFLRHPIEALAVSVLLENALKSYLCRRRRRKCFPEWIANSIDGNFKSKFKQVWSLMIEGRKIYSISLGNLLREPIFRAYIVFTLGFGAAGVYDIAKKIPELIRNMLTGGSQSYFSAYGRMVAIDNLESRESIKLLTKKIIVYLCGLGALLFAGYYACCDILFKIWLPSMPMGIISGSRVMLIWASITLINVPYTYLLQASYREGIVSMALWIHTCSILLLIPFGSLLGDDLQVFLVYWCVTAIGTQLTIYLSIHAHYRFLFETMKYALCLYSVGVIVAVFLIVIKSSFLAFDKDDLSTLILLAVIGFFVWSCGITLLAYLSKFIRSLIFNN